MSHIQGRAGGDTLTTTLRLPRSLRDDLKIQAIRAGRSLNTHIVMMLRGDASQIETDQPEKK